MTRIGTTMEGSCPIYHVGMSSVAALSELSIPTARAAILIAANFVNSSTEEINTTANILFSKGLIYVCTWGPECERAHDIFDEVYVCEELDRHRELFMSTWHTRETLNEALEFFRDHVLPANLNFEDLCYVVVTVASPSWDEEVFGISRSWASGS
jgi:hypothetical protein